MTDAETATRAAADGTCARLAALAARPGVWWGTLGALCVVLVVPLFLVDVPPLLDYPNHMARMYLLAFGQADPVLSRMYAPHWSIIPNLALDLVIPPMLSVLPLHVAGRMAVGAAILLPVFGCIALSRAAFGARSYWPLVSGIATYNVALRLGLINFEIAVGLALAAAGWWIDLRERRPGTAVAVAAVCALAVFFCHIMGVALLMLLLGCREATVAWRMPGRRATEMLRRSAMLAVVFAAPVALFAGTQVATTWGGLLWQPFVAKLFGVFAAFICQSAPIDLLAGAACFLFVYGCVRERRGLVAPAVAVAAAVLAICYAVAPFVFKGTGFFSTRFAVMFGFLLFAGFRPFRLGPRAGVVAFGVFAALFSARMVVVSQAWWEHNTDLAQIRAVIAPVEPGSKVLALSVPEDEAPGYWATAPSGRSIPYVFETDLHEAALLVSERRAFWPALFANPGQQPIIVLPPYYALASSQVPPPPHSALSDPPNPLAVKLFPFPADWREKFDYVLLLDAGGEPDLKGWAGNRMTLVKATDAAALFRINKPAPP